MTLTTPSLTTSHYTHNLGGEAPKILDFQIQLFGLFIFLHANLRKSDEGPRTLALLIEHDLYDREWIIVGTVPAADLPETLPPLKSGNYSPLAFNHMFADHQQIATRLTSCCNESEIVLTNSIQKFILALSC